MYADIPSVALGHHRAGNNGNNAVSSGPAVAGIPRVRQHQPRDLAGKAQQQQQRLCEVTGSSMAALGRDLVGTLRERSCNSVPTPPRGASAGQYRHLAAEGLASLRELQPQHRARDTCIYGFSTAALHVLIVCVVAPSFFYWYYRWRYRHQYRLSLQDHLGALRQRVRERVNASGSTGTAAAEEMDASLEAKEIVALAGKQLEQRYMAALQESNVSSLNNSVVRYRSLYIGLAFFGLTILLFVIWKHSPYRLPVARVVVGAALFAAFLCLYEYIFFEHIYLRFLPLQVPVSDSELYDSVAGDLCLALDVPAPPDQPSTAGDPDFVKQVRQAHRLLRKRQHRREELQARQQPQQPQQPQQQQPQAPLAQSTTHVRSPPARRAGESPDLVGLVPPVMLTHQTESVDEVRELPTLLRPDTAAPPMPPLVPEYHNEEDEE